ncbi:MAG: NAD(P)/FAD-dependent oxidoreductase [Thermodesulfobacteriota bacterium]|nr:NAD(P)/FAD-dependent oxidoreductase [Thermodesulfobacteriota bacterium]
MADEKFDAVVIGGGNKGLVTAMYLTKYGGLKTGIFEVRHEAGGGWSTEEVAAPGFTFNNHSTAHCTYYYDLIWEDFPDFKEKGGELFPASTGCIFIEDHSSMLFYHREEDPTWEKTAASLAKFSKRDAEAMMQFGRIWDEYVYPEYHRWVWTPPVAGQPDPFFKNSLARAPKGVIDPSWENKSLMQICDEIFESVEVKSAIYRAAYTFWGGPAHTQGNGWHLLGISMSSGREVGYMRGGTHSSAHAAQKIVVENGGKIFTRSEVEKVIIENGSATGIRLKDGTSVEAKVIVSTLSPQMMCTRLIGEEHLPQNIIRKIKALTVNYSAGVWWDGWALHEPPKYKAAEQEPDIDKVVYISVMDKDPWCLSKEFWKRQLGREWPEAPHIDCYPDCWTYSPPVGVDPSQAPPGKCMAGDELYTCAADVFTEKEWTEFKKPHADHILDIWSKFAPNMTWDNVIGYRIDSPWDITNRLRQTPGNGCWNILDIVGSQVGWYRPIMELSDHRTPIKGLYGTGSGWHPLGCGLAGGGYNCYQAISKDLGLRNPKDEKKRPY